ncbi:hypothetical protein HDU92_006218 [Lobulomyces angularis]|nr:hypothetical protein HDU92_006218 [Lobulomyces angularis]
MPTEFLKVVPSQLKKPLNHSTKNFLSLILPKDSRTGIQSITTPTICSVKKKIIQWEIDLSCRAMNEVEKLTSQDAVGKVCPNADELVLGILKRLNLDPEEIQLQPLDIRDNHQFPTMSA